MKGLINDKDMVFINEFVFNKEKTLKRFEKIGEYIIENLKEKLSFFKNCFFDWDEDYKEFYFNKDLIFYNLSKEHFIDNKPIPNIDKNIAEDVSKNILDIIFLHMIKKFSLKRVNDLREKELLEKYDNKFFYRGFCFDKHLFKKISIVLNNIDYEERENNFINLRFPVKIYLII